MAPHQTINSCEAGVYKYVSSYIIYIQLLQADPSTLAHQLLQPLATPTSACFAHVNQQFRDLDPEPTLALFALTLPDGRLSVTPPGMPAPASKRALVQSRPQTWTSTLTPQHPMCLAVTCSCRTSDSCTRRTPALATQIPTRAPDEAYLSGAARHPGACQACGLTTSTSFHHASLRSTPPPSNPLAIQRHEKTETPRPRPQPPDPAPSAAAAAAPLKQPPLRLGTVPARCDLVTA